MSMCVLGWGRGLCVQVTTVHFNKVKEKLLVNLSNDMWFTMLILNILYK